MRAEAEANGRAALFPAMDAGLQPRRLSVLHVLLALDPGGLERNVINQVRLAPRLNQSTTILCLERRGQLAADAERLGARILCLEKPPGLRPRLVGRVVRAIRQIQPDVVHTHVLGALFYAGIAARYARVPLVVHTEHGLERYSTRWQTRWLGRIAGRCVDRFYCLSEEMAQSVRVNRVASRGKVHLIANGIETARYSRPCDTLPVREALAIPKHAPLIGTVGRLTEIKRQALLIRAFSRISGQIPDAHLLLVGDGPLDRELKELSQSLKGGERVHFTGFRHDVTPYLQALDLFVLTSRSEGMPQALIEACALPAFRWRRHASGAFLNSSATARPGSSFPATARTPRLRPFCGFSIIRAGRRRWPAGHARWR